MIKSQIEQDLKVALLSGDKVKVTTLRGLKSAILYAEVAKGKRDVGLSEDETIAVLAKEGKKRQESADLYIQGGNQEHADAELEEKRLIDGYLPKPMSEQELNALIEDCVMDLGTVTIKDMGTIIGEVKSKAGASADGALVAKLVREKLQ